MKQCSDFEAAVDRIRGMDLSNAPEAFKEQVAKCAADTEDIINDFRQTVAHCEKSIGKSFSAAPTA
jgi:hypothetical protein